MTTGGAWYIDPKDHSQEKYWTGSSWSEQTRPRTPDAILAPGPRAPVPRAPSSKQEQSGLSTIAGACYLIAASIALSAVGGGIALISHQVCGLNGVGTSRHACSAAARAHPFEVAGLAAIIGGLLQALVVAFVGYLASETSRLRALVGQLRSS